jgi:hypothetical protein
VDYFAFSLGTPDEIVEKWQKALDRMKSAHEIEDIKRRFYPQR